MSPVSSPVHVNSATGIVGATGSGKTALIGTAAEYLADTYPGQVLLLYTADGGGYPTKVQSLIRLGIVRVWRMRTRGVPFETTMRASAGWFPSAINPATGETKPNVRLVPPITERYTMHCPNGHVVKAVPFASLLTPAICPTCKTHTTRENAATIDREVHRTQGFESVGAVAFDGLTSFQNWQMADMATRGANLELKGEETALGGRIISGDITLGGNNRSHYGFVQVRGEEMVLNSLGIPGLKLPPIWTGLLMETVDEGNLSIKGMKLAGKAKTDEAGAWFGNMLEISVVKDEKGNDVRRLSLNEYTDDAGTRHLIKHRGGPGMPPYLQDAVGQPWGQVSLGLFFDLLAKDIEQGAEEATARYPNAVGVPEGEVTYGEVPTEKAAAPVAAATPRVAAPVRQKPAIVKPAVVGPAIATDTREVAPVTGATVSVPAPAAPSVEPPAEVPAAVPSAPEATQPAAPAAPVPLQRPPVPARPALVGRPFAPPPAPRPPQAAPRVPAPRVPGLLPRK